MITRLLFIAILTVVAGCGTTTGNVGTGATSQVTFQAAFLSTRDADPAAATITICPKRVRLDEGATFDFPQREITITPGGSTLGTVGLAKGLYRRVRFDLDDKCPSGKSFTYDDGKGHVRSVSRGITIYFAGSFELTRDAHDVGIDFNDIVSALDTSPSGDVAERVDGRKCGSGSVKK